MTQRLYNYLNSASAWTAPAQSATQTTAIWTDFETQWVNCGSGSCAATVWTDWNAQYVTDASTALSRYELMQNVANQQVAGITGIGATGQGLNPELEAHYQRRLDVAVARERQRARYFEDANNRAMELLMANLDPKQAEQLRLNKKFIVHSENGERVYEVTWGVAGNIFLLKNGRRQAKYCIHPDGNMPVADVMLAQKLMIETDEERFLQVANRTLVAA